MREDSKPEETILPDRDYLMDLLKNIISFRTVALQETAIRR